VELLCGTGLKLGLFGFVFGAYGVKMGLIGFELALFCGTEKMSFFS